MEDTERVEKNINTECTAETIDKIEGTSKETTNKTSKEKANKEEIGKEKTTNKTTSKKGIKSNKKACYMRRLNQIDIFLWQYFFQFTFKIMTTHHDNMVTVSTANFNISTNTNNFPLIRFFTSGFDSACMRLFHFNKASNFVHDFSFTNKYNVSEVIKSLHQAIQFLHQSRLGCSQLVLE